MSVVGVVSSSTKQQGALAKSGHTPVHALLVSLVVMLSLSPRFEFPLGFYGGDLRLVDFFAPVIFAYLVFLLVRLLRELRVPVRAKLIASAAMIYILFMIVRSLRALLAVSSSGTFVDELVVRVGYSYRYFLPVLLALFVVRLISITGPRGIISVLGGILFSAVMNLTWLLLQEGLGFQKIGYSLRSTEVSMYGPALLGEGAVLNVGGYLVLMLGVGLGVAQLIKNVPSQVGWSLLWIAATIYSIRAVDSRASLVVAIALCFIFLSILLRRKTPGMDIVVFWALVAAGGVASLLSFGLFYSRISIFVIIETILDRLEAFQWPYFANLSIWDFIFGLGPGGTRLSLSAEAHSYYFGMLGDFGLVGLVAVLAFTAYGFVILGRTLSHGDSPTLTLFSVISFSGLLDVVIAGLVQDSFAPVLPISLLAVIYGSTIYLAWHSGVNLQFVPSIWFPSTKSRIMKDRVPRSSSGA